MGLNLFNIFCKKVTFEAAAKLPARPPSMETQEPIPTTITPIPSTPAKPTSPISPTRPVAATTPIQTAPESTATAIPTQPAPESTAIATETKTQEAPTVNLPPEMLEQILKRLSSTDLASAMLVSRSLHFKVRA